MAVSKAEFTAAQGYFFDLVIVASKSDGEVTAIRATIRGINGSKNIFRRKRKLDYQVLADVSDLRSELPTGWIEVPDADQVEHVNVWPANRTCPLTHRQLPWICWGSAAATWTERAAAERTLSSFLDLATRVLGAANLDSQAR